MGRFTGSGIGTAARVLALTALAGAVAGCGDNSQLASGRAWRPISSEMMALFEKNGTDAHAPMLIRTYKKEAEFEIWKMKADGRYVHVKTFPMCRWSGQLGPKVKEGDRQVPEGFYTITPGQMNPNSAYYLSFNVGYPNALDKALGHGGGSIMVHGACSSAGCFSMTDEQIADIYAVARESFGGGQRAIQMESFPFHMTAENLAKHRLDPNIAFWKNLKEGSDHFEVTKMEPAVGSCGRKYVFNAAGAGSDPLAPCPALKVDPEVRQLVAQKQARDEEQVAKLVADGVKPVRVLYADGGQNSFFASRNGDVSRPDALATGATEIALDEPKAKSNVVKLAGVKAAKAKIDVARAESIAPRSEPAAPAASPSPSAVRPTSYAAAATASISNWIGLHKNDPKSSVPAVDEDDQTASTPVPPRRNGKPQAALDRKTFPGGRDPQATEMVSLEPVRR